MSQSGYHNPADMPLQNPKEQIAMWQQNTYMSDSGIHSGATTNAPSLSGKEEEMDAEWLEGQAQQGFNQAAFTTEQVQFNACNVYVCGVPVVFALVRYLVNGWKQATYPRPC